ncbi:hypothetical protein HDU85_001011 [Gaertneriomyces sp. JEL0708]|nr:hypothetical protein HDU85_001011 [Gaertneriomyces sp. JEL0708]
MMGVGYPPNMSVANGKVNSSVPVSMPAMTHGGMPMPRLNFPLLNASSPVSKIPKPPPGPGYGREMAMASGNAGNPASLNMAHYPHSASTTISPFSSGAFGVPPYGANYYTDLRRSAPSQLRPPNIQPQRAPPAGPAKSPVMQSPYQNVTALLQAAQNEFGTRNSDRHGEDDNGFGSGQREGVAQAKVLAMPPKTEFEAKFEQAAKEAKRRCKPGDVAVVNDERLLRVPRGWRERSLGYVVYKGPTMRHPTSTHPDDIQLFLLPPFGPEHHYATVEVRIPARWLLYRNNVALRKGAVWGTDVYTDDSDVVAVVTHAGWYKCGDDPHARLQRQATPSVKTEPPSTNESVVPSVETGAASAAADGIFNNDAGKKDKDKVASASFPTPPTPAIYRPLAASSALPDHDLIVTLRVLPRLVKYTGSLRNGIHSRGWGGGHDGESIRVENVEMVEKGVEKKGRGKGVKQWLEGVKEFKLRTIRSSADNDDSDYGRSRSDYDEGRSDILQYSVHDEDEEDDDHEEGAEGNKWMRRYAEDGWPASEPAEGFGGVTVMWSDNGEACLKYSPRLLINCPPYLHEKSFNGKEVPLATANRATLRPAAWKELLSSRPYWCIRLGIYEDTLVMDTADQERVEIAKKVSAVEREMYVIKRVGGTSICVEPERIAFDEDECVVMGSDGAVERRFPVVRFFWKRQHKDRGESSVG